MRKLKTEKILLSSFMFFPKLLKLKGPSIDEDIFFNLKHRDIFRACIELSKEGVEITPDVVISKMGSSSEAAILQIIKTDAIQNVDSIIDDLYNAKISRNLAEIRDRLDGVERNNNPVELLESSLDTMSSLTRTSSGLKKVGEILDELDEDAKKAELGEYDFKLSGFKSFDKKFGGFIKSGLNIIAGRPSMGKSSMLSQIIDTSLSENEGVLLFSMEVSSKGTLRKLLARRSKNSIKDLKSGLYSNPKDYKKAAEFYKSKEEFLHIDDGVGYTIKNIIAKIEEMFYTTNNLKLVLLDHILQVNFEDTFDGIGELTKSLKRTAQKLGITIIALSQLNRKVENRDNKRPQLSDLQGSGSIEQDADLVSFVYRSDYYLEREWNYEEDGPYQSKDVETIEVIVSKNRDGDTGTIELNFEKKYVDIRDIGIIIEYEYGTIDDRGNFTVDMPVI